MIDEYQLVLEPALRSLRELRSAYRRDAQRDLEACNSLLRVALAHIERHEVQIRVDRFLPRPGTPLSLDRRQRHEFLEKEAKLSRLVGKGNDRKTIKRALNEMPKGESTTWATSTRELVAFLSSQHTRMCDNLQATSILGLRRRRHNARVVARADQAALAVGIVLADVLEKSYLLVSYAIGGAIARSIDHDS